MSSDLTGGSAQPGLNRESSNGRNLIPSRPQTASSLRNQIPDTPESPAFRDFPGQAEQRLLPPTGRARRFRDDDSQGLTSPGLDSRRTSWSSDGGGSRDSRVYSPNPFADSRAPSRAGSDDDHVNTQTVSEKYNILPSAGLLLFPEDVEKDDYLHNPSPDDDKAMRECDIFTKRGMVNVGGLALITLGVLALFIGFPIAYVAPCIVAPRPRACMPAGVSVHCADVSIQNFCQEIHTFRRPLRLTHGLHSWHWQSSSPQKCQDESDRSRHPQICLH